MAKRPVAVARFDERPRIAVLPDGGLWGLFVRWADGAQEILIAESVGNPDDVEVGQEGTYEFPASLEDGRAYLSGRWRRSERARPCCILPEPDCPDLELTLP